MLKCGMHCAVTPAFHQHAPLNSGPAHMFDNHSDEWNKDLHVVQPMLHFLFKLRMSVEDDASVHLQVLCRQNLQRKIS